MPSIHDLAAHILLKRGPTPALKLQALCFYCQVWSLVWDEQPLFEEVIEAWPIGPIIPALYEAFKDIYLAETSPGNPDVFSAEQEETIEVVIKAYARFNLQGLTDSTHSETPWLEAYTSSDREISHDSLKKYYGSLNVDNAHILE